MTYQQMPSWQTTFIPDSDYNGSVMNVVCYERGLLWAGLLCYEQVCYERGL